MAYGNATIYEFPVRERIDRQAADAVHTLARAELVDEAEAVRTLEQLGMTPGEIDLVRAIYAARRHRRI